jgi:predicted metal-dependent enzyme (double-stranded beta helix superfamily)
MRTKIFALSFIAPLLLAGCAATQPGKPVATNKDANASWPWPDSMDAVSAATKNHKVLYEDERVRILEVTVEPGEKENMHYHRWPSVLIIDSPAKKNEYTSDGKVTSTDRSSAETPLPIVVRMGPTPPHAIENLDTNSLHLYRIEMKKIDARN